MLYSCLANEEHDLSHPSIQNMKSKCLNKFISLHWTQKELKVRLGLDVCLADLCGTSHPRTGERPARPPIESRAGPDMGPRSQWWCHGLTRPLDFTYRSIWGTAPFTQYPFKKHPLAEFWVGWGNFRSSESSSLSPVLDSSSLKPNLNLCNWMPMTSHR